MHVFFDDLKDFVEDRGIAHRSSSTDAVGLDRSGRIKKVTFGVYPKNVFWGIIIVNRKAFYIIKVAFSLPEGKRMVMPGEVYQ